MITLLNRIRNQISRRDVNLQCGKLWLRFIFIIVIKQKLKDEQNARLT